LVFQNGIVLLALTSMALIWAFHGELDLLLPLYAVGVFLAFTLSQSGMVRHWLKFREKGWQKSLAINAVGATATGIVMVIILFTKFSEGAWLVVVLLAILFMAFKAVKARYGSITRQLQEDIHAPVKFENHSQIVLVPRFHAGIVNAIEYSMTMGDGCHAVHVAIDDRSVEALERDWAKYGVQVPLVILPSPYRSLVDPVLEHIDALQEAYPGEVITVIVPEAVPTKWLHRLLMDNVAAQIKSALGTRRNVVITNVRYHLD